MAADTLDRYRYELHVAVRDSRGGYLFVHGTRDTTILALVDLLAGAELHQVDRPTRSGQYPLPLDGVRRVATPKPAPTPAEPPRSAPRTGRQLRLPLDLPKPPRTPRNAGGKP